jgi:hypothetical protein
MSICLLIGGVVAYRYGIARTANEVQERVINALQGEIAALHERVEALEKENTRLGQTVALICAALKQRGMHVTIDGNMVGLHDETGSSYLSNLHATRIFGVDEACAGDNANEPSVSAAANGTTRRRGRKRAAIHGEEQG